MCYYVHLNKEDGNTEKISFNHPQWAESNNKKSERVKIKGKVSEIKLVLNPIMM